MLRLASGPFCGRTECAPPRKPSLASFPGLPPQAHPCRAWPPWRNGLRTPAMTPLGSPEHVPPGPPGVRSPLRDHAVPRPASCPVSRTRRPHPSEKTTARVVSGFSLQGHSCRAWPPWRGGLRTPATGLGLDRGMCPWVTRLRSAIPWKRNPSAHVRFSDAGAQSAPLRENPLSSYPCPLPRKAIVPAPDRPWDVRAPSRPGEDLHPKVPGFTRHVQKPLAGKAPGRSRIVSKEGEALEGVTAELLWVT